MNLAITGGSGFLGYHLCNLIGKKYDQVTVLDIVPFEKNEFPDNVSFKHVDIRDIDALKPALKDIDIIVHATAALPLWSKSDIISTNETGAANVLKIADEYHIKRVILISSTAVYGIPKRHPIYEDDPKVGVGPYGVSKIAAEKLSEKYRDKGLCVPIIRPKTFIGTGRLGVFQILYDWVYSGKKIPIIGKGDNKYQLLEVEDLVNAIDLTMTLREEVANDTYNIGAMDYGAVKDDVGALCREASTGARALSVPSWLVKPILELFWTLRISPIYKWVYGTADKDSFVSTEKAQKKLNWKAKYSNADALIRSYRWYLDHIDVLQAPGLTHRAPWKQGVLSVVKKFL